MSSPGSIFRAAGATPAERYLGKLCTRAFLSLWSYPAIYRNQRGGTRSEGKEVCDLLVVFGNQVIIFSDKHCVFRATGNPDLDWSRWFRRCVTGAANQLWGAERWIKRFPDRLFLDPACTHPFPLVLPDPQDAQFHLVAVVHGIAGACREYFGGGSGSLIHKTDARGTGDHKVPFVIGDLDPSRTFVHVFDDTSLDVVMGTLDTVSDFLHYLGRKAALMRGRREVMATGEEELLAWYLKNMNEVSEHDLVFPEDVTGVGIPEGGWEAFQRNPQRLAQIEQNRISYSWDSLIEEFSKHALGGTQYFASGDGLQGVEEVLRFCARESRTRRRMLAQALKEMLETTGPSQSRRRVIGPSRPGDPHYVFLLVPRNSDIPYDEYRRVRREFLEACMRVTKLNFPEAMDIVGIATETGLADARRSEDASHLDCRVWTAEHQADAERLQRDLQLFVNPKIERSVVHEYPAVGPNGQLLFPAGKNPRNKPCPCGSGRKYKKCHGQKA
jgi:hypothetical protein